MNPANKMARFLPADRDKFEAVALTREEAEAFLDAMKELYPDRYSLFLAILSRSALGRHPIRDERGR